MRAGFSDVRLEVTTVEPPLIGETVDLFVLPPLSFGVYYGNFYWFLWPALVLWPFFIITQAIWALLLVLARRW